MTPSRTSRSYHIRDTKAPTSSPLSPFCCSTSSSSPFVPSRPYPSIFPSKAYSPSDSHGRCPRYYRTTRIERSSAQRCWCLALPSSSRSYFLSGGTIYRVVRLLSRGQSSSTTSPRWPFCWTAGTRERRCWRLSEQFVGQAWDG
jgi:hypothetical protein